VLAWTNAAAATVTATIENEPGVTTSAGGA